jgi:hypothetical protein
MILASIDKDNVAITMRDLEVSIGPTLKLWVVVTAKHLLVRAMEMLHVILVDIAWGNVSTSTKPLNTTMSLKTTVDEMHGRAEWDLGVHHR